ncbi:MAG: folate-binding protein YgfZ [Gammaproteobacteria bacterium]|nr:folate-binding protein YgfZ [Gammaproteobacteria bacterium]
MKTEWKIFLENAGALVENGCVQHFGNPTRELKVVNTGSIIADLSHVGLIAVYGDDAIKFLQGQFTNDLNEISENYSQLNGMCNPKGRMLAIFRIFQRSDRYYLRLPQELLQETIKKLRMYVLRSNVTLEEATDTFVRIGLSGPSSESQLKDVLGKIPETVNDVLQLDNLTVIRIPGINPRFEIIGEIDNIQKLWSKLDVHSAPVGADVWASIDVLAGIPTIYKETTDMFVPQMVNFDVVGGVNFKKGCYTGQEIVARMHYLGKLKKRMYLAHVSSTNKPLAGTPLYAKDSANEQSVGNIVDTKPSTDGYYDLLTVIKKDNVEKYRITIGAIDGPEIEIKELPYSLDLSETEKE